MSSLHYIGINGFGRIGKCLFLQLIEDKNLIITAININNLTLTDFETYINNDSVHKLKMYTISILPDNYIKINDKIIKILTSKIPGELNWRKYRVEYLFETSGKFLTTELSKLHNVDYLIMSAPPKDLEITPIFCYGVNDELYNNESVISTASCTTNCITPFLKSIEKYGIDSGSFITVHSATASQTIVDNANMSKRINRSVFNNIIPHSTGASKCIDILLPSMKNKIKGTSVRVPVSNVSMIDINIIFNKSIKKDDIFNDLSNINSDVILLNKKKLVSSDYIGEKLPTIIDKDLTIQISDKCIKFTLWYDNEWSYSNQMIQMCKKMIIKNTKYLINSINTIDFLNKSVLMRCDFNCPINNEGVITDDFRIKSAIPSIKNIISLKPSKLIIMTHFGRPKNKDLFYSTKIFLDILENLLSTKVTFLKDGLDSSMEDIQESGIYLMENVRFHSYETKPDNHTLKIQADIFCNEAFSCSHRDHMSITRINCKEKCFGYCFLKEIESLNTILNSSNQKITAIVGGNKIDDKLQMLDNLSKKINNIYIAGNNINAYNDKKEFINKLNNNKANIILMKDGFGNTDKNETPLYINSCLDKKDDQKIFDIGPKSLCELHNLIGNSDIIFWNGTLGIVEDNFYKHGSEMLINFLNYSNKKIIIGGGDTAGFVNNYSNNFYHVSTGGGASIEYLSNGYLIGMKK